jgi:adenylylsulfate kinase-like enzyme
MVVIISPQFYGTSDSYEEPKDAEIVINTAEVTPEKAAQAIIL